MALLITGLVVGCTGSDYYSYYSSYDSKYMTLCSEVYNVIVINEIVACQY